MLSRRTHEMPLLTCSRFKVVNIFQSSECATSSLATSSADFKFYRLSSLHSFSIIYLWYTLRRDRAVHTYIYVYPVSLWCAANKGKARKNMKRAPSWRAPSWRNQHASASTLGAGESISQQGGRVERGHATNYIDKKIRQSKQPPWYRHCRIGAYPQLWCTHKV